MKHSSGYQPFKFTKFDTPTYKALPKESSTASYQRIKEGLNISGICENKKCVAFEKEVVVSLGFKEKFNIAQEVRKAKCVECKQRLEKVRFVQIYMAKVKGNGMKAHGDETDSEGDSDDTEAFYEKKRSNRLSFEHISDKKGKYLSFGKEDKQIVLWDYLHLEVKELEKCPNGHHLSNLNPFYFSWAKNEFDDPKSLLICLAMKDEISEIARWVCDKCDSKFDGLGEAKSCRECDYDVCAECCEK